MIIAISLQKKAVSSTLSCVAMGPTDDDANQPQSCIHFYVIYVIFNRLLERHESDVLLMQSLVSLQPDVRPANFITN